MKKFFMCLFVLSISISAQASQDADLFGKIQNAYSRIDSFEASFDQTLTHKESGAKETRKGTIQFRKPLKIRWQTQKPNAETLVINPNEIWDYLPDEQIAYRYNPGLVKDSRNIIQVITGQAKLDKDFDVKRSGNENGMLRLSLYPKEPSPDLVEAAIWVDPETGVIHRANVTDFYGNTNDIAFKTFKPGAQIPEKSFTFTPPKGTEVEDRIKSEVPERDLFK